MMTNPFYYIQSLSWLLAAYYLKFYTTSFSSPDKQKWSMKIIDYKKYKNFKLE